MGISVLAFEPAGEQLMYGIDVSRWQKEIDFEQVGRSDIEIVYIKATEGLGYADPNLEINYQRARENNLQVGFYHYVTAKNEAVAREQARYFYSVIEDKDYQCKPVMDFEAFGNLSREEINRIGIAYIETLEELTGQEVIVYSNYYSAANRFDDRLADNPLWIAHYGVSEPGDPLRWDGWVGFQYSDTGRIDGIAANVDMNLFTEGVLLD